MLIDGTLEANYPPNTGEPSDQSKLVESLQDQVSYLRGQSEAEREAGRRKDHLLAAALERILAIEAPRDALETASETASDGEGRGVMYPRSHRSLQSTARGCIGSSSGCNWVGGFLL